MRKAAKASREYATGYKKRDTTMDPYYRRESQGAAVCEGCGAMYQNKRWYRDEKRLKEGGKTVTVVCPACLKIRDNFPGGIVTLQGDYVLPHKSDLLRLVKNEEERARGYNPLERVMSIKENGRGSIVINTTNEKLAQRLGRAIKKAFHGTVKYRWSHDNKLVRVDWVRDAA